MQGFVAPKQPFRRMRYSDAITYLSEHKIYKEDGEEYQFGDVRVWNNCNFNVLCCTEIFPLSSLYRYDHEAY